MYLPWLVSSVASSSGFGSRCQEGEMIFVVCGQSRDGDKNTPCPLGLLDDLCICLPCLPRTNSGLSNLGSSLATGRASIESLWSQAVFSLPRSLSCECRKCLGCAVIPVLQVKMMRITLALSDVQHFPAQCIYLCSLKSRLKKKLCVVEVEN